MNDNKISIGNINPLSQEGGELLQPPPPLSDFPSCRFCVFAKIAIRTLCPDTHESMKKNSKTFAMKKVGGGGGVATAPPVLRGKGWQQK